MNKYIIITPPWRHSSAGIQVMHRLCHLLRNSGEHAYVSASGNPDWDNPQVNPEDFDKENDYIIYPDIIASNPYGFNKVIRYMLYYPQINMHGNKVPKNELCIPYAPYLWPDCNYYCEYDIPEEWILEISIVEPDIFCIDSSVEKDINTYWIGKGRNYNNFHLPEGCILIPPTKTRKEMAHWFQRSKNFYCFDVNSGMPPESFLCGAKVFLIGPDARITQWWGWDAEENKRKYNCTDKIEEFIKLTKNFDYDRR